MCPYNAVRKATYIEETARTPPQRGSWAPCRSAIRENPISNGWRKAIFDIRKRVNGPDK